MTYIERIKGLLAEATEGPWEWSSGTWFSMLSAGQESLLYYTTSDDGVHCDNPATKALIAEAPTLAARLIEAEAQMERMAEALGRLHRKADSVMTDVKSAHHARGNAASEWMREDDRDFRDDLCSCFELADAALASYRAWKGQP